MCIRDRPETTRFFNDKEAQPGEWHIDTIAVVPQARGKGVGSKLLAACESVAKANHKQIISLNVDFNNPGAKNYTKKWVIKSLGN
ncbi:GNAT family N-acetyltransferase [Latilactobacillus curvatus]|uniref:GNAT family N-acetyltransferase n=1 Tax=Latilactobacillus curvatus TaxID=28038 RepID=UPI0009D72020|nr:GNAT family N-acetyltransferase [Latilactobacillus curvatus]